MEAFSNPFVIAAAFTGALLILRIVYGFFPKPIVKGKPALPGRGWDIIYTDNHRPAKEERRPGVDYGKMLTHEALNLCGKPDFIYSDGRELIPAELKSGKIKESASPREGDLMQLAAYFFLAEAEYGLPARKGLLIYGDAMFTVRNTRALRETLVEKLNEMNEMLERPPETRAGIESEAEPGFVKCRYCACRGTVCEAENTELLQKYEESY